MFVVKKIEDSNSTTCLATDEARRTARGRLPNREPNIGAAQCVRRASTTAEKRCADEDAGTRTTQG
jgi:hypothetical protein